MGGEDLIDARDQPRPHDHVCFAFGDPAEFREAARSFLAEGLAAGYQVVAVVRRPGEYESWHGDEAFGPAYANGQADVVMAGPADRAALDAFARWEYLIDRCIATSPLDGMCGLEAAARTQSATVLLRSRAPYVRELVELLGLTAVRVEVAG